MNLQITLLILGAIVIAAVYLFSRWQENKRRENQAARNPQSSRRGARDAGAGYERNEPGFGEATDSDHRDSRYASLDRLAPPELNDYVDADRDVDHSGLNHSGQASLRAEAAKTLESELSGVSTLLNDDTQSESEPTHSQPAETTDTQEIEEEDFPTLENMVSVGEAGKTDEQTGENADLGDRFVEELDELSDMVDISQGSYESENEVDTANNQFSGEEVTEINNQSVVADDPANNEEEIEDIVEPPLLDESEVVIPGSFNSSLESPPSSQSSLIEDDTFDAESGNEIGLDGEANQSSRESEEEEYAASRPSLKAFLGSIGAISKLKENIQNQLESVKADRERALSGADAKPEKTPDVVLEADLAIHTDADNRDASLVYEEADELATLGSESTIDQEDMGSSSEVDTTYQEVNSGSPATAVNPQPEQHDSDQPKANETIAGQGGTLPNGAPMIEPAEGFDKLSQIDYYVKLSGERDVSRDSVLAIYREGAAGIARTHSIYGLRLPEKVWRDLEQESEDARFGDLVVTIQLVDQEGLVTEDDMTRFSSLIMKLSESTGRGFSFMAPIENAHKQAEAIGRFRQQFDSIFVVNIRPLETEVFEGAVIERCAKQIGLTADDNQFFARYKPVGKQKVCLYSLANMSDTGEFDLENMRAVRTRGVTFFTRPAINRSPGAVFAEMVDAAKAFASRIKGEVIAPGYEDLSTEDVEAIRRSIEQVAAEMEAYGINPGSEEATRLFG